MKSKLYVLHTDDLLKSFIKTLGNNFKERYNQNYEAEPKEI